MYLRRTAICKCSNNQAYQVPLFIFNFTLIESSGFCSAGCMLGYVSVGTDIVSADSQIATTQVIHTLSIRFTSMVCLGLTLYTFVVLRSVLE